MKKSFLLILIFFLVTTSKIFAQKISIDEIRFRNPFESALPKKEEIVTIREEPVIEGPESRIIERKKPEIKAPALRISGLIWNSDRPQAIINDEVVGIGDVINGSVIIGINQIGIKIKYMDKYFVIEKSTQSKK